MARLKFLVFALLVLAVWTAHLVLLTPPLVGRSVELAMAQAQAARPLAQAQVSERRQLLQRTVTKLAAQPKLQATALAAKAPSAKEAVPPEKLQALSELVEAKAPDALKGSLVFGYATEGGATFFRGGKATEGLDAALAKAGQDGMVQEAFGVSHLFVSLPVWDKSPEPKQVATLVLGAPLLTDGMMEAVAKDASLAAAGVFHAGRLVQGGGAEKARLEKVEKLAKAGTGTVVERGSVGSFGPLQLPLFTSAGDRGGGRAPLLLASRQAIEDTPYEFIALTSVQPMMSALGGYQRFALGVLGGLVVLTLVWAVLMGGGGAEERDEEEAAENELAPGIPVASSSSSRKSAERPPLSEMEPSPSAQVALASTMPDPSQEAEGGDPRLERAISQLGATREDDGMDAPAEPAEPTPEPATAAEPPSYTAFGASSAYDAPAASDAPPVPDDPFAQYQTPGGEGATRADTPFASPGQDLGSSESEESTPAHGFSAMSPLGAMAPVPVSDPSISAPFSQETLPRFSSDPNEPAGAQDDNPDATRVATIPQELLDASARRTAVPNSLPSPRQSGTIPLPKMPSVAAATPADTEEAHFQEVYREFVETREQCGEGADGLTYDKFAAKLRKNKEQLVQKYGCKTVRFQVYVKEGKAALKATPVKD